MYFIYFDPVVVTADVVFIVFVLILHGDYNQLYLVIMTIYSTT
jgi:hypothetical protein